MRVPDRPTPPGTPTSVSTMTATATLDRPAPLTEGPVTSSTSGSRRRLGMRWKLLLAFGAGFTAVFVIVAWAILQFSTTTATDRVRDTLRGISTGGTLTIDVDAFVELKNLDLAPEIGAVYPDNAGFLAGTVATAESEYPTDERYWDHVAELAAIRRTNPEASPYSYALSADGLVRAVGSWGALGYPEIGIDQPDGFRFQQLVTEFIDDETLSYFTQGFVETTEQPAYSDTLDSWISVYSPITDSAGEVVGALGVDYPLSYVDEVRSRVLRVLYPVFGISYVVLLGLVVFLSSWLTRRLARLSAATARVADGDYDVDLTSAASARFSDEMTELADSFRVMTEKVGTRERTLVQQVQVLKVEIDEAKRQQAVAEITDTDFFLDLTAKASALRAKVKAAEDHPSDDV